MSYISNVFAQKVITLDGGTGTELWREHKIKLGDPLFSAGAVSAHPEALIAIHGSYLRTGAQIIDVASFRTNEYAYQQAGRTAEASWRDTRAAVGLGFSAIKKTGIQAIIAGGITSRGDTYNPNDRFSDDITLPEHQRHLNNLVTAGANVIFIETMPTVAEAEKIAKLVPSSTPFTVSYVVNENGHVLDGNSIAESAFRLSKLPNFAGIGINCCPIASAAAAVENLIKAGYKGRLLLYPNGISAEEGPSGEGLGWSFAKDRKDFKNIFVATLFRIGERAINAGMTVALGGCCGTTPDEINDISHAVNLSGINEQRNYVAGFRPAAASSTIPWMTGSCCGRPHGLGHQHRKAEPVAAL